MRVSIDSKLVSTLWNRTSLISSIRDLTYEKQLNQMTHEKKLITCWNSKQKLPTHQIHVRNVVSCAIIHNIQLTSTLLMTIKKIRYVKDLVILTGQKEVSIFRRNGRVVSGKILETLVLPPTFVSTFLVQKAENSEITNYLPWL